MEVIKETKKRKLVMFTSLPNVGGHSTLTIGLARLFRLWFEEIEIWVKVMPEHGHSTDVAVALENQGCRLVYLSDESGRLQLRNVAAAIAANRASPPDVFFVLAMRKLSPVLSLLVPKASAVYFHITHDLDLRTRIFLKAVQCTFNKLVFICPATFEDYGSQSPRCSWAPQASELPGVQSDEVIAAKQERAKALPRRVSFGLSGRLTREKGAEAVLGFIKGCSASCDFHVAGGGPFEDEFKKLSRLPHGDGPRVFFHGSYPPTERLSFLRNFFGQIDWLLVPSIDEWETLSMVTLEALQHGTPILCSSAGGLRSFGMPELGPAPGSVIRLFDPADLAKEIMQIAFDSPYDIERRFRECREHYAAYFSDQNVVGRWKALVG